MAQAYAARHGRADRDVPDLGGQVTRAEQDRILATAVMAYARMQGTPRIPVDEPASLRTLASFRAALRLDDPKLDELIRQGAHKRPWSKEAVRA